MELFKSKQKVVDAEKEKGKDKSKTPKRNTLKRLVLAGILGFLGVKLGEAAESAATNQAVILESERHFDSSTDTTFDIPMTNGETIPVEMAGLQGYVNFFFLELGLPIPQDLAHMVNFIDSSTVKVGYGEPESMTHYFREFVNQNDINLTGFNIYLGDGFTTDTARRNEFTRLSEQSITYIQAMNDIEQIAARNGSYDEALQVAITAYDEMSAGRTLMNELLRKIHLLEP